MNRTKSTPNDLNRAQRSRTKNQNRKLKKGVYREAAETNRKTKNGWQESKIEKKMSVLLVLRGEEARMGRARREGAR